jgi:hypothetical protein
MREYKAARGVSSSFQHSYDVQIFNLNISLLNLPKLSNQGVIDAYETAFAYEISDSLPNDNVNPFSLHLLIDFFGKNLQFAQFGFYQGFGELLFNTIISDTRAVSEMWVVSVLLKIASLGISDPHFIDKIDKLIDGNLERFASNALLKLLILLHARDPERLRHREYILKRLRTFNPDNI